MPAGGADLRAGARADHGRPFLVASATRSFSSCPLFAALLVWLTFLFGRRFDDERDRRVCARCCWRCSPIFLYQAVQPMSDVPAAAAWLAALVTLASCPPKPRRRRAAPRLALVWRRQRRCLIRPNLALLVLPLLALPKRGLSPLFGKNGDCPRFGGWVAFGGAAALPGVAVLLALNAARYGGPLASGYGDAGALHLDARDGERAALRALAARDAHTVAPRPVPPPALRRDAGRRASRGCH